MFNLYVVRLVRQVDLTTRVVTTVENAGDERAERACIDLVKALKAEGYTRELVYDVGPP